MMDQKKQETEFMRLEEKRLLSIIANLRSNIEGREGISFANDLLGAETRLLLLRRKIDLQLKGAFK